MDHNKPVFGLEMMMGKYAERDHEELESGYSEHLSAMTGEKLHGKSAIAAELAHRDAEIERLTAELEQAKGGADEHLPLFEFGNGGVVVSDGYAGDKPALFIRPAVESGKKPGQPLQGEDLKQQSRGRYYPGERVLTFQTIEHASTVARALMQKPAPVAVPDDLLVDACFALSEIKRISEYPPEDKAILQIASAALKKLRAAPPAPAVDEQEVRETVEALEEAYKADSSLDFMTDAAQLLRSAYRLRAQQQGGDNDRP